MNKIIDKLDSIFTKYINALETANVIKQRKYYDEYLELKKEIKPNLESLTKEERKKYKIICSEFRILSNEIEREKLFGNKNAKAKTKEFKTNKEYLKESKTISSNTTKVLKNSLVDLEEAKHIGENAIEILEIDNDKIKNTNDKMDNIQSDSQIAIKLISMTLKRLYTDKIIIMFTFIIVCLIVIILLFKYNIVN